MKIFLLWLFLSVNAFSLVVDTDERYHPTIRELTHDRWVNPAKMDDKAMGVFAPAIGAKLQDGYKVAAVQFNNCKQAGIINTSVPEEAPLIVFVGNDYTIAVYQVDDKKPLGNIKDCLKPESIRKKEDWGLDLHGFASAETFYEPDQE